jgi:hypothetical protein
MYAIVRTSPGRSAIVSAGLSSGPKSIGVSVDAFAGRAIIATVRDGGSGAGQRSPEPDIFSASESPTFRAKSILNIHDRGAEG